MRTKQDEGNGEVVMQKGKKRKHEASPAPGGQDLTKTRNHSRSRESSATPEDGKPLAKNQKTGDTKEALRKEDHSRVVPREEVPVVAMEIETSNSSKDPEPSEKSTKQKEGSRTDSPGQKSTDKESSIASEAASVPQDDLPKTVKTGKAEKGASSNSGESSKTKTEGSMTKADSCTTKADSSTANANGSTTKAEGSMTKADGSTTKADGSTTKAKSTRTNTEISETNSEGSTTVNTDTAQSQAKSAPVVDEAEMNDKNTMELTTPVVTEAAEVAGQTESSVKVEDSTSSKVKVDWQASRGLYESVRFLFESGICTDVTFRVGPNDETAMDFQCHRNILAVRSPFFFDMFYKREDKVEVHRETDVTPQAFHVVLRHIYMDDVDRRKTAEEDLEILYAARKYDLPRLSKSITSSLEKKITTNNVLTILAWSLQQGTECKKDLGTLTETCVDFIEDMTTEVFESHAFLKVPVEVLAMLLKQEGLTAAEIDIFRRCLSWARAECHRRGLEPTTRNQRSVLGDILEQFNFKVLIMAGFGDEVVKSGLLEEEELQEKQALPEKSG